MEKLGHSFIAHTEHLLQSWEETDLSTAWVSDQMLDSNASWQVSAPKNCNQMIALG